MADTYEASRSGYLSYRLTLGRPRLVVSVVIGLVAYALLPQSLGTVTRLLVAWNIGTLADIVLNGIMVARADTRTMRWRAGITDDGKWVMLGLSTVAALAAMGAILIEIGIAKNLKGSSAGIHYLLAGFTIVSAWVFIHLSFALHYAHEFFDETKTLEGEDSQIKGGLRFPDTEVPDYWDFLYFSFVIGVASQTADVEITSKEIRRTSLAHSILSFFFNSAILALTINIAAGLV